MSSKKLYFLFILLSQLRLAGSGQSVEYLTGEKIQPDDPGSFQIFSYDSTRLFAFRINSEGLKSKYRLQTYSRDSLKRLSSIPVPFTATNSLVYHPEYLLDCL